MNFKKKLKPRDLSTQELILISILGIMGLAYSSFKYVIMPKYNEYMIAQNNLETTKMCCEKLKREYEHIDDFKQQEIDLNYKLKKLEEQMPPYISEEDIILTLGKYAHQCKVKIETIALDNEKSAAANAITKDSTEKKELEEKFKDKEEAQEMISKDSMGNVVTVLTKYVDFAFEGELTSLYNFLDKLENNQVKIFVKEIALNTKEGTFLTGNIKFQYWAYKDKSNCGKKYKIKVPKINGKINLFKPYAGYKSVNNDGIPIKTYEPNFYLKLKKVADDGPKFIMSEYRKQETEIYSNMNGNIKGMVKVTKENDKFTYTYKIGDSAKTEEKNINIHNGVIRMNVDSRFRTSNLDKMTITMDIENNTDLPFEIVVTNDDDKKPLFKLGDKVGKVFLKQVSK